MTEPHTHRTQSGHTLTLLPLRHVARPSNYLYGRIRIQMATRGSRPLACLESQQNNLRGDSQSAL